MSAYLAQFINILFFALWAAILGRVLISWINISPDNPIAQVLYGITEPILAPIRRVVPSIGMLDLSPMIALIIMMIVQRVLLRLL